MQDQQIKITYFEKHAKAILAYFLAFLVMLLLPMPAFALTVSKANTIDFIFRQKSELLSTAHLVVLTGNQNDLRAALASGSSSESFAAMSVDRTVSSISDALIVRPKKADEYSAFLFSSAFIKALHESERQNLRCDPGPIAVEISITENQNANRVIDIYRSDNEPKHNIGGAWIIRSRAFDASGTESKQLFVLRFPLESFYNASDIQLVTAGSDGSLQVVDSPITISSGANGQYYARTSLLRDGLYALVTKSGGHNGA